MIIGQEFETEKGVATYLGDVGNFAIFVHLSPTPKVNEIEILNPIQTDIEIFLAPADDKTGFLGRVPLLYIVGCAADKGLSNVDNSVSLSKNECMEIDDLAWETLGKKYKLVPTKFVMS